MADITQQNVSFSCPGIVEPAGLCSSLRVLLGLVNVLLMTVGLAVAENELLRSLSLAVTPTSRTRSTMANLMSH